MKLIKLVPMIILALVLTVTIARAAHIPEVLLNPSEWTANTENDLSLTVKNSDGDNIVKVELIVPQDTNQIPVYVIKDVTTPGGWTYYLTTREGQTPYKITWKTTGPGIATGETLDFGFTALSPASGSYEWNWKTTDVNSGIFPGESVTKISMAAMSYFKVFGVPDKIPAGSLLKITVKAYGNDNSIKTDYAGTVSFTSSDTKALLPKDYIFTASDKGSKDFYITYKTAGGQTFTVTDWTSKITQKSAVTKVEPGSVISISITPEDSEVSPGSTIGFKAIAKDKYNNVFEITNGTKWSIDKEAGGSWSLNVYKAGNEGTWTVTGTYNSLMGGTGLTVAKGAVAPTTPEVPTTPIVPTTPSETPTTPTEVPPVVPTAPLEEMNIKTQGTLTIAPGSNETFIVTVNNVGTKDQTDVTLTAVNVSENWITVYPSKITIEAGTSRDFLVVLSVPANETESKKLNLVATSNEGVTTTKSIDVAIGTAPTGLLGFSKNLLNLGIVIVAVAALVLIAWELWFRKPK